MRNLIYDVIFLHFLLHLFGGASSVSFCVMIDDFFVTNLDLDFEGKGL